MADFSLNIKTCCLYVILGKQDKIWAKSVLHPQKYAFPYTYGCA